MTLNTRQERRLHIKTHIRKTVKGTPERPRLTVYRSLQHLYAAIVDDTTHRTLLSVSTLAKDLRDELKDAKSRKEKSRLVGKHVARKALEKNITTVVFDRGGYLYHGLVREIAEGAREGGLQF
ncbi:MAG: 50S ribosomal protein L18 [Ignavibacteriales bacterium CG07_land_8_20_14_0_80_59_12]|jgi:large subunit ribosomal protein L18|nr:MAG: 50S ribosomal protein L18 [Ignavibacteriales bacterium CG07_land_8_20_14_0_80_59_12]